MPFIEKKKEFFFKVILGHSKPFVNVKSKDACFYGILFSYIAFKMHCILPFSCFTKDSIYL